MIPAWRIARCNGPLTGEVVDRDHNAARNLRDWSDMPVGAQSGRRPRSSVSPAVVSETVVQTVDPINGLRSSYKTTRTLAAVNREGQHRTSPGWKGTSQERARMIT
jgi:hypothetical protein